MSSHVFSGVFTASLATLENIRWQMNLYGCYLAASLAPRRSSASSQTSNNSPLQSASCLFYLPQGWWCCNKSVTELLRVLNSRTDLSRDSCLYMTFTLTRACFLFFFTCVVLFHSNDKSFNRGPLNRTQSIERPGESSNCYLSIQAVLQSVRSCFLRGNVESCVVVVI